MIKKLQAIFVILFLGLFYSCSNSEYIGSWHRQYMLFDSSFFPGLPDHVSLHSDYSYGVQNGTWVSVSTGPQSGTYTLTPDSIFFGNDPLERFKITEITSTHLTLKRSGPQISYYGVTIRFYKM